MDGQISTTNSNEIVIIGAGISGLCLGIQLKRAGVDSFTILEQSDDVAGTWLKNTYPGCGCDVPAMLYSFSFDLKYDWSRKYALQPELLDYFRSSADRFQLRQHIQFGVTVSSATFDEETNLWKIQLESGEEISSKVLVSAVGQLNRPKIPNLLGLDSFQGSAFHSAQWDHSVDLKDKKVAVIGSGASAIQIVPEVAKLAAETIVVQRSPNYIKARNDYEYSGFAKSCFRFIPGMAKLHRYMLYWGHDWIIKLYQRGTKWNLGFRERLIREMRAAVPKKLWRKVIPKYTAGCKRVLLSDNYLQTLAQENVTVHDQGAEAVQENGVVVNGETVPVDVIVFATGFESTQFLAPMSITGSSGKTLNEVWQERPKTYFGITTSGFPNFFMLYGPNTNLGHNSIIFMVECQVNYILKCLNKMKQQQAARVEVSEQAVNEFDQHLQQDLDKLVWKEDCGNWYSKEAGTITNNWSGMTIRYWWQTRSPDWNAFNFSK